jgi:hypothetical protein
MRIRMPLLAGTVLSLAAVASQDPGPVDFPRMSIRHPLASYQALAAAPFGNGPELFALVVFIYASCILTASWRHERRQHRGRQPGGARPGAAGRANQLRPSRGLAQIRCPAALPTGRSAPHKA